MAHFKLPITIVVLPHLDSSCNPNFMRLQRKNNTGPSSFLEELQFIGQTGEKMKLCINKVMRTKLRKNF